MNRKRKYSGNKYHRYSLDYNMLTREGKRAQLEMAQLEVNLQYTASLKAKK
jgi:hypothetical protein